MNIPKLSLTLLLLSASFWTDAQTVAEEPQVVSVEGYAFEEGNRGYVRNVNVSFLKEDSNELLAQVKTDKDGKFAAKLPVDMNFQLVAAKKHFISKEQVVTTKGVEADAKVFLKVEMERKPGYVFDVTLAEAGASKATAVVNAIEGARVEVFNNTTGKQELDLKNYPYPNFKFTFEKGNHYTLMIRKKGFLNKRIEAYIDVDDCILCFDGLGIVDPGVTDVLTNDNEIGTFLANIELERAQLNKTFAIENIYYDYDQFVIRDDAAAELQKLFEVLNDNPGIIIEMGSHTDSRGRDPYNRQLSDKRAKAAVDYLVEYGKVDAKRLTWKGYGESSLVNDCGNGAPCKEQEHQLNRRTELKIVGFQEKDPIANRSLKDILVDERLMKEVNEGEVIKVEANPKSEKDERGNE